MESPSGGWISSSRRDPCAVCGRTHDTSCRVTPSGLVLCWRGSTYAPPTWACRKGEHGPGADGQEWAFLGDADGWALFRLHESKQHLPRSLRIRVRRSQAEIVAGKMPVLIQLVEQALAVPPFEQLLDVEFEQAHKLIVLALQEAAGILPRLSAVAKGHAALERFQAWLQGKHRELEYQAADADCWATSWEYRLAVYSSGSPVLPEEPPDDLSPELPPYEPRDPIVLALYELHRPQGMQP